jgi:hypothetical protein
MASVPLKVQHHFGEFLMGSKLAIPAMIDLPVLAEAAQKIAV